MFFFPRLNFDCWLLSRAFLFDLLHAGLMTLDNFKCYSRMCIALKKVKDEWFKDERKIDGYREKKIRRNSQREAERWETDWETDRQLGQRLSESQRQKKKAGRELKEPQQKPKAH